MNRFLLIDDDDIITKIHPVIIRRVDPDCLIDVCENGPAALDFLTKLMKEGSTPPNFIFLDINMPILTGFEMLDRMSEDLKIFLKDSNIILLSSSIDPSDVNKGREYSQVKEFASKPLSMDYLNKLING